MGSPNSELVKKNLRIIGTLLIRQMLLQGLLSKDIEDYGILKLPGRGNDFGKKPKSFPIVLNNLFEEANADDDDEGGDSAPVASADDRLFNMLKDLRQKESKKRSLPLL